MKRCAIFGPRGSGGARGAGGRDDSDNDEVEEEEEEGGGEGGRRSTNAREGHDVLIGARRIASILLFENLGCLFEIYHLWPI